ncbi:hypothetical protein ACFE04_013225 [Oxalis oulophora]
MGISTLSGQGSKFCDVFIVSEVQSHLISNIATDARSAEKYYYFLRLMGRKASHVALECTLQSHPNLVILGEEVAVSKLTLFDLTKQICDAVQARAELDKNDGVILLPEGLIENIPEIYALLKAWEGVRVVASARKLIGATNPLQAEPGTIRGDLDVKTGRNVVHGSDSPENGEREIDPDEISELGTPRHRVHEREDGSRFRSDNALTNTTRDKYPHVSGSDIYTLDRHVRRLSMESVKSDLSSVRVDGIPNMMSRAATARTDDLIARLNQEVIVRQFLRKKLRAL